MKKQLDIKKLLLLNMPYMEISHNSSIRNSGNTLF